MKLFHDTLAEAGLDDVTTGILTEFSQMCEIPHGSEHEMELAEHLAERFRQGGCAAGMDAAGNLVIDIPADPQYEAAPVVMLQGHLDMVCAVKEGSHRDLLKEPVIPVLRRDRETDRLWLSTDGTTSLGADCGIGNAAILWLLGDGRPERAKLPHGPLRLLFTVREEQGLLGALELDASVFNNVKYVINVDGFTEGQIAAGCAGGRTESYVRPCMTMPVREIKGWNILSSRAFALSLDGFAGGHSGFDIDKGRVNALQIMASLLKNLRDHGVDFALSSFHGGIAHNVIPSAAEMILSVRKRDMSAFTSCISSMLREMKDRFSQADPEGWVSMHEIRVPEHAFNQETRDALIDFLTEVSDGPVKQMTLLPDIVDSSCNTAIVEADASHPTSPLYVMLFERSMDPACHRQLQREHAEAAARSKFKMVRVEEYPAWIYREENPLLQMASGLYQSITGKEAQCTATHVGLEPAVFASIHPGLTMISTGADILDAHSVNERVPVDTIRPFALLLKGLIETIAII